MKATVRTNLGLLILLLILCQVAFNSARPNSLRGSRRNSANKINKGKRGWTATSTNKQTRREGGPNSDSEEKKDAAFARMWLELEGIPPTEVEVKPRGDLTLECVAVGSPPPMLYWLKNGKPVENFQMFSYETAESTNRVDGRGPTAFEKITNFAMAKTKSKLQLRCVRPEDEAEYTCLADNEGKQLVATTIVTIAAGEEGEIEARPECEPRPSIFSYTKKGRRGSTAYIMSYESLHMETIGSDIILPCRGVGRPRPFVSWVNADGQRIVNGKKYHINTNGDLAIRSLSWSDMGEFLCTVENSYGSDSSSTFLYPMMKEES